MPTAASLRVAAWRRANPGRRRVSDAAYRERHREELRAKNLAYYHARMQSDPEAIRKQRREWVQTPKGVVANRAARHRRRGAPLTQEAKEWWLSLVDPACAYCGKPATEIDHIVPISKGGTGELANLAPACRSCNARKNDKEVAA